MAKSDANRWPEFHLAKYANQVVLLLAAYTLYKWFNEDVGQFGFESYLAFAGWLIFAVSGNSLTLFVVSREVRSRFWKVALTVTIGIMTVSAVGLIAIKDIDVSLRETLGWGVTFVFLTHVLNLFTLVHVAQVRRRA
ncbi:MAG: hypothetical protein AAFX56_11155 [Pseudomonadota bacterium]